MWKYLRVYKICIYYYANTIAYIPRLYLYYDLGRVFFHIRLSQEGKYAIIIFIYFFHV